VSEGGVVVRFGHIDRPALLTQGLRLAWITIAWSLLEGVFGVASAWTAGSVALLAFGLDSLVEAASGSIIVWRTHAERGALDAAAEEQVERRAGRLVAVAMALLAAYIAVDAVASLVLRRKPDVSVPGLVLTSATMVMMQWLARRKRVTARALGSRSMQADAFQTMACFYLAFLVLAGIGLNALFGWWWADPAAALVMVVPIVQEARESWAGGHDHDSLA
jgi:divalent metal cation (Fe/Co/Zn/Cd) transporter